MKKAVITGITGQDGAYLAELLLEKGYSVVGCFRRCSTENFWRIEELGIRNHRNLKLLEFELTDVGNAIRLISTEAPDEVYNLAAQSFVGVSFEQPVSTSKITGLGALHLLEAIRIINPKIKFYQASTSEMFGKVRAVPQNEETPFYPRSPYAVAKLFAHWATINYRESYEIFATSGILFNHESPLRGIEFVTRKITQHAAKYQSQKAVLELGNLDAKRDWGFAKDYVEGMYLMMQHDTPDTFVLATGVTSSVREFVEAAFAQIEVQIKWQGSGVDEKGICNKTGDLVVSINPKYFRPTEVDLLLGDATKAEEELGWKAQMGLKELVEIMVQEDIRRETLVNH